MLPNEGRSLLCLMQLPPPHHGAAAINREILDRTLPGAGWVVRHVRLTVTRDRADAQGRTLGKIVEALGVVAHCAGRLIRDRPDLVYLTVALEGLPLGRDLLLTLLCRLAGRPMILHLHGTDLRFARGWRRRILRWVLARGQVVTLADALAADVRAVIGDRPITVLPNAVPERPAVDRTHGAARPVGLLYLANLNRRKGIATTLRAYGRAVDAGHELTLTVAGGCGPHWREAEQRAVEAELSPRARQGLRLVGPVDAVQKAALYADADIFVYPTEHDAFPLVVLEAMSWGIAVVASAQAALPHMLGAGAGVVLDEVSPASLAAALGILAEDPERRRALGWRARHRQRTLFSPSVFDAALLALFDRVWREARGLAPVLGPGAVTEMKQSRGIPSRASVDCGDSTNC